MTGTGRNSEPPEIAAITNARGAVSRQILPHIFTQSAHMQLTYTVEGATAAVPVSFELGWRLQYHSLLLSNRTNPLKPTY